MRNWLLITTALVAFPTLAVAGPIEWSYHTEVTYAQDYGPNFTVTAPPYGTAATMPGEPSYVWLFNSTGNPRPDPGSFEARYEFTIAVTITDLASGQSGMQEFSGSYVSMWMYQPEEVNNPNAWRWEWAAFLFGDEQSWRTLQLGNNQYDFRAFGAASGSFPYGELNVDIHPTVAATPEPGTLALAALGLGAIGLRIRKYRPAI
jgi:hypothetical protein